MSEQLRLSVLITGDTSDLRGSTQEARRELDGLADAGRGAGRGLDETGRGGREAGRGLEATGKGGREAATGLEATGRRGREAATGLEATGRGGREAAVGLERTERATIGTNRGLTGLVGAARTAAGALAAVGIGVSFGVIAREAYDVTVALQTLDARLTRLTGSQAAAAREIDYLRDASARLSANFDTLSGAYTRLLPLAQAGLLGWEQARAILEGYADVAAATGASNQQLEQSLYGLSQGLSSGTLRAEELNQIVEPLPGFLLSLDRAFSRLTNSTDQVAGSFRRAVNEGKVTSEMLGKTLVEAVRDYEGAAESMAGNVQQSATRLTNAWRELLGVLSEPVADPFADLLSSLAEALRLVTALTEAQRRFQGSLGVTAGNRTDIAGVEADLADIERQIARLGIGAGSDNENAAGSAAVAESLVLERIRLTQRLNELRAQQDSPAAPPAGGAPSGAPPAAGGASGGRQRDPVAELLALARGADFQRYLLNPDYAGLGEPDRSAARQTAEAAYQKGLLRQVGPAQFAPVSPEAQAAIERLALSYRDLAVAQTAAQEAAAALEAQQRRETDLLEELRGPQRALAQRIEDITRLWGEGRLTVAEYAAELQRLQDLQLDARTDPAAGVERGVREIRREWGDLSQQTQDLTTDAAEGFVDAGVAAFRHLREEGISSWQDIGDAALAVLGQVLDALTEVALKQAVVAALGGPQQPAGGSGLGGVAASFLGALIGGGGQTSTFADGTVVAWNAPTGHEGALIGSRHGPAKSVPLAAFLNAPRHHGGTGPLGLQPDEVPFIGLKGERVLNLQETADYEAGRGGVTNVYNNQVNIRTPDPNAFRKSRRQIIETLAKAGREGR